jgi:hypothetical protein
MARLGSCSYGTDIAGNVDQEFCQDVLGGQWNPNAPVGGGGFCAVRTILARALCENILQLGSTYHLTYLFRDKVLNNSVAGRRLLKQYYSHADELYSIVVGDPDVLAASIKAWSAAWPFIKAMLESASGEKSIGTRNLSKLRFSKTRYAAVSRAIKMFRVATSTDDLKNALDEGDKLLRSFTGKTPQEALGQLIPTKKDSRPAS